MAPSVTRVRVVDMPGGPVHALDTARESTLCRRSIIGGSLGWGEPNCPRCLSVLSGESKRPRKRRRGPGKQ